MLKILGKIFIILGVIIITSILFTAIAYNYEGKFLTWLIGSSSLIALFLGISFLHLNKPLVNRKKFVKIAITIAIIFLGITYLFKFLHLPGTSILFILSFAFVTFSILPVFTKNKIEKWNQYASKRWHSYLLSFGDLISAGALILGYLFKKMHWPGANIMLDTGLLLLAICLILWNRLFSKEIILRKKAEQEAELRLKEIEKQKHIIEEKNEEIISSIRYARRIQNSLMPSQKYLEKTLKNS
ncbi:MAG: hypothetical protein LCH32_09325 [Bacteroidetes bacterium]|jgi:hypothetical protein|nr:hypothetical protein [Bacteroidota bacterium]